MKTRPTINKKNIMFILLVSIAFISLLSYMKYTGFAVYRVPFGVEIDILNSGKEVDAGDVINANIIFYNLLQPQSIKLNYSIKNLKGDVLVSDNTNIFVQNETVLKKSILIPKSAPSGYYLLVAEWDNSYSKVSTIFKVRSGKDELKFLIIKLLMSLVLIAVTLLIIILIITHNNALSSLSNLNKARISLFFWKIGWILKQHNYYIKYILVFIILCLLGAVLTLINY
ncbi:hypothetical protein HYX16_05240 [Candidatus Woesearchaeota archaeon]|nr:hypothetical protein [Candidatus Woesearchaeota archaeon]